MENEYEPVVEHPAWIRPEQNLMTACIIRAIQDLSLPDEREAAIEWICSDDNTDSSYSFRWICLQLGLEYSVMFDRMTKLISETASNVELQYRDRSEGKSRQRRPLHRRAGISVDYRNPGAHEDKRDLSDS